MQLLKSYKNNEVNTESFMQRLLIIVKVGTFPWESEMFYILLLLQSAIWSPTNIHFPSSKLEEPLISLVRHMATYNRNIV